MRMTTRANVHQLSFMPRLFPVNAYLVEEQDGLTLIDAALPYSAKGMIDAAARIGKPIRRILLTHAHGDHIGALDRLKSALPDAEVLISARDSRLLAGDKTLDAIEIQSPIRGAVPKPGAIRTRPDTLIADGDRVGSLLAVATPGHTPGSMSFLDTRTGSLIAGDAFQVRGGMAVSGKMQPLFPFPAMATWSPAEALRSAKRLIGLKPTLLAVGHGRMVADPLEAMTASARDAERSLESQGKGGASHVTANRP
ncbi:Glyoxylase, beta-lactamase superfamily II [Cohnella sp. OV330]|uniref:MBL fold metallo-hydrolase n=1 Tax=Cohnella sp. OV330 TaxID=1855288 RepID=UPI0008E00E7E|nr:MBL fold metallo-hydrolase [Cohnella sp. OV330]SFA98230.1 Glyoxylase, beta-lactamase superfamily II [Cohnella sp. OV330]